ncbi:MAG: hypothetical protein LBD12_02375 [Clostridiales Family XIII bacterium]|nr:hypothetical protein [Clostridiales Family XIII bacterium]
MLALTCIVPVASYGAAKASNWPSFRGDVATKGVTAAKTPRTSKETVRRWVKNLIPETDMYSLSNPIIVNNRIYVAVSSGWPATDGKVFAFNLSGKLLRQKLIDPALNPETGKPYGTPTLGYIGAGGGMVFVPLTDGTVRALDAVTLEQKWKSSAFTYADSANLDPATSEPAIVPYDFSSPILYRNGYIYTGVAAGWSELPGCFFALRTADVDTSKADEVNAPAWTWQADGAAEKGYYNVGAAFTKNAVVFAGTGGLLVTHSLTTSTAALSTYDLGESVKSEMVSDGNAVYGTTMGGRIFRAAVDSAGKVSAGSVKKAKLSGEQSSVAPVVYRGKVYAVSGKQNFTGKGVGRLDVFAKNTLKKKSTLDLGDYVSSSPLLSKGYATKANGYKVHLYVMHNAVSENNVIRVTDSDRLKKPVKATLFKPGGNQGGASLIADTSGNLYFYSTNTDAATYKMKADLVSLGIKK